MLATFSVVDSYGKTADFKLSGVADIAEAEAIATALAPFISGVIQSVSASQRCPVATPVEENGFDSVEAAVQVDLEDTSVTEILGRFFFMHIPAPKSSILEGTPRKGFRMITAAGQQFATDLNTALTRTLNFVRGQFKSDASQKAI